jgi:uncharacterized protein
MLSRLRVFVNAHVLAASRDDSARIVSYDLARAVAIGLMILVNFQVYLLAPPTGEREDGILRWLAHVPSGRSSSLFVILAGVGVAQMSRRARLTGDAREWWLLRRTLLLRSLFLLVSGALLITVWEIDILHFYAAYLALSTLFVRRSSRALFASAVGFVVMAALLSVLVPEELRDEVVPLSPLGIALNFVIDGIHPVFPWMAFLLYGMWLGRLDLGHAGRRRAFAFRAAALAVTTELVSSGMTALAAGSGAPASFADHAGLFATDWTPAPLYVVSAWGTGTCIIALAHEAVARFGRTRIVRALVSTGQLSLSIYLFHALVGVGIPRWIFGLGDGLAIPQVVAYWATFFALTVPLAAVYRAYVQRGPIETVMRLVTGSPERGEPAGKSEASVATVPLRRPSRVAWALVAAGVVLVLAGRVVGLSTPRLDCGPTPVVRDLGSVSSELTLLCPRVWVRLDVGHVENVTLSTRSGVDVYLEVHRAPHDGRASLLVEDDDSGPELDAQLTTKLTPGTYDVLVRPYSAVTGPFSLRVVEAAR